MSTLPACTAIRLIVVAVVMGLLPQYSQGLKKLNISCRTCAPTQCQSGYYYLMESEEVKQVICVERGKVCNTSLAAEATINNCTYDSQGTLCPSSLCLETTGVWIAHLDTQQCGAEYTQQLQCAPDQSCPSGHMSALRLSTLVQSKTTIDRNLTTDYTLDKLVNLNTLSNKTTLTIRNQSDYSYQLVEERVTSTVTTATSDSNGTTSYLSTTITVNLTRYVNKTKKYELAYIEFTEENTAVSTRVQAANPINITTIAYSNNTVLVNNLVKYLNSTQTTLTTLTHNATRACVSGCPSSNATRAVGQCTRDHFGDLGAGCCFFFAASAPGATCTSTNRLFNHSFKLSALLNASSAQTATSPLVILTMLLLLWALP